MTHAAHQEPGLLTACLDFFFPPLCAGCSEYCDSPEGLCDRCRVRLDRYELPFCLQCLEPLAAWPECPMCREQTLPLFALGNYVDPLKQVIAEFKFHSVRAALPWLCGGLLATFETKLAACQADCLVPIPLHAAREYERGYNQATVLALELADRLALPVRPDLIARPVKRRPQQQLRAHTREANIRGVFAPTETDPERVRILLVDDVVTSGSTAREAARVLTSIGHRVVGVISLAHGI